MSIRKRLFLSNLLMIVIPAVICTQIAYSILFLFTGRSEKPLEQSFPRAVQIITKFHDDSDVDSLLTEAEEFNLQFADKDVFLAVVQEEAFLFPQNAEELLAGHESLIPAMLESGVTGSLSMNNLRVMIDENGSYRLLLVDLRYQLGDYKIFGRPMAYQLLLIFGVLLFIVLTTNRLLTRLLTRSITKPLGMLADGVHQLRDGNLSYRINYTRKDEFAPVCADFNEMAEHLQRMIDRQQKDERSRKELLAGIAHDLRTPLTSIKAYVEGLLDGVAVDQDSQVKYLRTIRQKAEDIDSLVDKLFLFSKLDMDEYPFQIERVNVTGEVEKLLAEEEATYRERGLKIVRGEMPTDAWAGTDPVQLRSALLNVLENGVLYKTKPQGEMLVECVLRDGWVDIVLTDDGPGVPEEELTRLFEVFYRSDPSRQSPSKGSGLGLAITQRILERMGGSVTAENVPEGGLRITLSLPREE
ncbi:MAG: sensor histidine kinase [Oscillospiraceae bacterium]